MKLQPPRKQSVVTCNSEKIAPKFYGPYKVLDKHGKVYSNIHPMFHVSQLKKLVGEATSTTQLPTILQDTIVKSLEYCLQRIMVKRQGRAAIPS